MSALTDVMNAQACNDAQELALFNPTPEVDSLGEALAHMFDRYEVTPADRKVVVGHFHRVRDWNQSERAAERRAAGALDAAGPRNLRDTIGVRGAAAALRPVLGRDFQKECSTLRRLIADPRCGMQILRAKSLSGQLGRLQYARLLELLDAMEASS